MGSSRFLSSLASVAKFLPAAAKPAGKPSLREKLAWTGLALIAYLVMADIPLFGISSQVSTNFSIQNLIFASRQGTLMQLGIGPIVTAGMIMQILAGSKILNVDLSSTEDRIDFTAAQKTFAVLFTFLQGGAYVFGGIFGSLTFPQELLVFGQLIFATLLVILLDEMIQKGWGVGSGISLFILAGVAFQVVYDAFSYQPAPAPAGAPVYDYGSILAAIQSIFRGDPLYSIIRYPVQQYSIPAPDIVGLITTVAFILILIYLQGMKVEIPVVYQKAQGYRSKIPLQFLYVSNVPVLLAGILFSDYVFFSEILWKRFDPTNSVWFLNILGKYTTISGQGIQPIGGLAYYVQNPIGLGMTLGEPVRALVFTLLLTVLSVIFAFMWVEIAGLSPRDQADQLANSGLQIAGFRSSVGIIESVLRKPVYALTFISSLIAGLIAGVADILGAYGSGMGLLLAIGIVYQMYQILVQEQIEELYPGLARILE
ncbi:MAG: preprotein translocase subunit SecY [Candidatus Marsarchaeota archaeon]|nr:preprotein translocase subunit SecY [Candidatus Marsarchaeota archaeon]